MYGCLLSADERCIYCMNPPALLVSCNTYPGNPVVFVFFSPVVLLFPQDFDGDVKKRRSGAYLVLVGCRGQRQSLVRGDRPTLQSVVNGVADTLMRPQNKRPHAQAANNEIPRRQYRC